MSPNPRPKQSPHRTACACNACRRRQGTVKVQKAFRLNRATIEKLASAAQETGLHQNEIIEEALRVFWQVFPRQECICGEKVRVEINTYCPNHPHPYEIGSESSHARGSVALSSIERRALK